MELVVEGLRLRYPDLVAVQDVELGVPPGEVVAVVGPNGCGKSTLLRGIARLHQPAAGRVLLDGKDLRSLRQKQVAHRVALLPQTPQAPEAITVAGLVAYGRHPHQGLFRHWSIADEQAVTEALAATGITELADRRVDRLSGGQRQRCWLAMVLAQHTALVLLDEPTSMLDLGHKVEVLGLVRQVAATGRTVIMVVHDLDSAARYADRVVAMLDGRVVANGPPREIVDADLVHTLYGVEANILNAPGDHAPVVVPTANGVAPATSRVP